jgi:ribonuclease BN (tRNA processing enzyme)
MRILIVGVGDAFTRKHFGSSALIETTAAGGPSPSYVLIDCPDLIHRALHEATARARWTVDASNIHDIIITHLHGDHCNGLESFGFFRRITRVQNPGANTPKPRLHTSAPVAERLWQRLAPAMDAAMGGARWRPKGSRASRTPSSISVASSLPGFRKFTATWQTPARL